MIRKHVYFQGTVQGVFFRANTREKAAKEEVTGWVRNLRGGRVEAVFEGPQEKVDEVIRWCKHDQPRARVTGAEIEEEEYTGEYEVFEIRR